MLTFRVAAAIAALGSALVAGASLAQTGPAGDGRFIADLPNTVLAASKVIGVGVIGADHVRVGSVEDVVFGPDGRAEAVVIGVGGFLGLGEKRVAVPFGEVLWNTGDVSPAATPSASVVAGTRPVETDASAAAARMPGAQVSDRTLAAPSEQRSGAVDPATGPVAGGAGARRATELVGSASGKIEHAEIHLTKAELERAPAFTQGSAAKR